MNSRKMPVWKKHPEKNAVRSHVCRHMKQPYKAILVMPSYSMLDVRKLITNGSINKNTKIFVIEGRSEIAQEIERKLVGEYGYSPSNVKVINKNLHDIDLVTELGGVKLDFAYIDTCSQLNKSITAWLVGVVQQNVFTEDASINLAFCRYNQIGIKFYNFFNGAFKHLKNPELFEVIGIKTIDQLRRALVEQQQSMRNLLGCIFGKTYQEIVYKNSGLKTSMHLFQFKGVKRPLRITKVIETLHSFDKMLPIAIKSAGIKAWATRKGFNIPAPRIVSADRTDVAKRAWKTRLANAAFRTATALKAWETRRVNESEPLLGI